MAKLKPDPIGVSDLLLYLDQRSDFSFELKTLKGLREQGVVCEHGGHYEDPVTKKSREFDIRAIKSIGPFTVRLAIECKNIQENSPILVSCVPRQENESYHEVAVVKKQALSGNAYDQRIALLASTLVLRVQFGQSVYSAGQPTGKSTAQVARTSDNTLVGNDGELYEKWGQCLSSADDLVRRIHTDSGSPFITRLSAVFPILVVPNKRLWAVSYDENGNRVSDPQMVDHCSCFIDKDYELNDGIEPTWMSISHLDIVTLDGLKCFVSDYLLTNDGMSRIFPTGGMKAASKFQNVEHTYEKLRATLDD